MFYNINKLWYCQASLARPDFPLLFDIWTAKCQKGVKSRLAMQDYNQAIMHYEYHHYSFTKNHL